MTEAKIVHLENGKELNYDEEGELMIRGPQVMQGYFKNPKETKVGAHITRNRRLIFRFFGVA